MRSLIFTCLALVSLVGVSESRLLARQDTPIKSVSLAIETRPNPAWTFAIANHYHAPIEAFHFRIDVGHPTRLAYDADMSRTVQTPPADHGPIQPGERRTVEYDPHTDLSTAKVILDGLVFGDGHYEGDADVLQKWFGDREVLAKDLKYWIDALDGLPGRMNADIAPYLRQKDAEHSAAAPDDPSKARASLRSLLAGTPPEGTLDRAVTTLRARLGVRLELATRHLHPPPDQPAPVPVEQSAEISLASDAFLDVVAIIHNQGHVPLEAWRIVPVAAPAIKVPDFHYDECTLSGAPPNRGNTSGPIPPGGRRELVIFKGDALPQGTNVTASLSLVIFSDLSFEGSVKERDQVYRAREGKARERTFWIDALNTALARPATALPFLQTKLEESQRRGDVLAQSMQVALRNFASLAERTPDQLPKSLTTMRDTFEHERTLLLRHVAQ